jgi:MFS family permease
MYSIGNFFRTTFASLSIRNYRLYFIGQGISQSGTWMQTVSLGWLSLQLTASGSALGLIVAAQFVPLLLFGPWGGAFADRHDKRRILFATQALFGLAAALLSLVVYLGITEVWMLFAFALVQGALRVFDDPARQTFVSELVDPAHIKNAVSLNGTENNLGRAVGPSIGAGIIAAAGLAFCFLFNAISYLAVILMLFLMREEELHRTERAKVRPRIIDGLKYVRSTPVVRDVLIMAAIVGTFAYEFQVSLPLIAESTFHGDASTYAALMGAFGVGSVIGGLFAAGRHRISMRHLARALVLFGASMIAASLAPSIGFAMLGLVLVGIFSMNVISLGNTMVQLESAGHMRGRVLALWSVAMVGSTPIGGPIVGFIGEHIGARWGLACGGIAALVAVALVARGMRAQEKERAIPHAVQIDEEKNELANPKLS